MAMAGAVGSVRYLHRAVLPRASISCQRFSKMVVRAASLPYRKRRAVC